MGPVRKWLLRSAIGIPVLSCVGSLVLVLLYLVFADWLTPAEYRGYR